MIDLFVNREYNLKNELLSGLTVALALVPEAVAFAFVAGVDPTVGLWAAFFMGMVTSLMGGRPGMISGATGATAVVMTAFVVMYGLEYLFAAVILCGLIQILCGVCKIGKFVRILPHSVMLGFVNGLAIVIGLAQINQLKYQHHVIFDDLHQQFAVVGRWMTGESLITALGLIIITMAIIYFLPKLTKAVPGTLVAIIGVTLLVQFTPIQSVTVGETVKQQKTVAAEKIEKSRIFSAEKNTLTLAQLNQYGHELASSSIVVPETKSSRSAGSFQIPGIPFSFESFGIIIGLGITLAAIGLIESLMTLTLIDELSGTRGSSNRECIGQGLGNITSGLFGSMGGCAMIGQSMINFRSGGRTRISSAAAALFLLGFIVYPPLGSCINMIPVAALIGVMFIVVIATFEWTSLRLWNKIPKSDMFVIVAVSAITVLADLAVAVASGIVISALVFAWKRSQNIQATIIEDNENELKTYALNGALFFASVTSFKEIFSVDADPKHVNLEFKDCRVYDHSALEAINTLCAKYRELGKSVKLLHLSKECQSLLVKAEAIIEVDIEDPDYHLAPM